MCACACLNPILSSVGFWRLWSSGECDSVAPVFSSLPFQATPHSGCNVGYERLCAGRPTLLAVSLHLMINLLGDDSQSACRDVLLAWYFVLAGSAIILEMPEMIAHKRLLLQSNATSLSVEGTTAANIGNTSQRISSNNVRSTEQHPVLYKAKYLQGILAFVLNKIAHEALSARRIKIHSCKERSPECPGEAHSEPRLASENTTCNLLQPVAYRACACSQERRPLKDLHRGYSVPRLRTRPSLPLENHRPPRPDLS